MNILEKLKAQKCICITPDQYKRKILEQLAQSTEFYYIEFLNIDELKKKLLYEYQKDALWKFSIKENEIPENAKIVMDCLYAIEKEEQSEILYSKKEWLKKENLIIFHPAFLKQLKTKKIFIYGYEFYEMKFLDFILRKYTEVIYIKEENKNYIPEITEYETLEQEVVGVAEKISKLILKGISIDHIYLGNLNSDYESVCFKIFHQFHIPYEKKKSHSLFEYEMIQNLLQQIPWDESLECLESLICNLEKKYPKDNPFYHQIYESLFTIANQYYSKNRTFREIKDIFIYDLKHTNLPKENFKNVLKEVDFKNTLFEEEDYIFLMGANLGEFPFIYEDQDYFSDLEKIILNLPTSQEMTDGEEIKIRNKIEQLPHVFLSYKKRSPFKEYLPSNMIEYFKEKHAIINEGAYEYTNQSYNEYLLHTSLDEFVNFGYKNKHLNKLYGKERSFYQTYNNQFTGISSSIFTEFIPYCTLSYTGMQKFFECPFKYYMQSILKVTIPYEETASLMIGNLFHHILEEYFKNKENMDFIIEKELKQIKITPEEKRNFYIEKYKKEIKRLILLMETQISRSSFSIDYLEEEIGWTEKKEISFHIFGKLDRIMTALEEDKKYAVVVDYKTGVATSDLSKIIYGMNMQLPLYLYLLKGDKRFKDYILGGAYIEAITASIPNYEKGKTIEELLWKQSKLDGFTLKRTELVKLLDHNYEASSYIKGIRVKSDGEFYQSNKLIEANVLDSVLEIVRKNIDKMEDAITKAEFFVNPKKFSSEIGNQISSCNYCHYRDICYLKTKNITTLKEYKNLEFLEEGDKLDCNQTERIHMDR